MSDRENRTETPTIKRIGQARAEGKLPAVTLLPGTLFFFAALLAAEILAANDPSLREKLAADRAKRREKVLAADAEIQG